MAVFWPIMIRIEFIFRDTKREEKRREENDKKAGLSRVLSQSDIQEVPNKTKKGPSVSLISLTLLMPMVVIALVLPNFVWCVLEPTIHRIPYELLTG